MYACRLEPVDDPDVTQHSPRIMWAIMRLHTARNVRDEANKYYNSTTIG